MKLLSCEGCGIVIDQDRINLDEEKFKDSEGDINLKNTIWDGDDFLKCIVCPVCEELIETTEKID